MVIWILKLIENHPCACILRLFSCHMIPISVLIFPNGKFQRILFHQFIHHTFFHSYSDFSFFSFFHAALILIISIYFLLISKTYWFFFIKKVSVLPPNKIKNKSALFIVEILHEIFLCLTMAIFPTQTNWFSSKLFLFHHQRNEILIDCQNKMRNFLELQKTVNMTKRRVNMQRLYKVSCPQGNFSETVAKSHTFINISIFLLFKQIMLCFCSQFSCHTKLKLKFKLCIYLLNAIKYERDTSSIRPNIHNEFKMLLLGILVATFRYVKSWSFEWILGLRYG